MFRCGDCSLEYWMYFVQVRNHLWVFVNCLIENPTFDSQTKENMTKQAKSFGSKCQLSEKFVAQVCVIYVQSTVNRWV